MPRKKNAAGVFMIALLLFSLSVPVLAAADPYDPPEYGQHSDISVLDEDELASIVDDFMTERKLKDSGFTVSFCYTGTGETWSRNGDTYIDGCSLYKLALNMLLARELRAGTITVDTKISGYKVSFIMERSLVHSDNPVSEAALVHFGGIKGLRKTQAEMAGIPEEELPSDYYSTIAVSADMMMALLKEIYSNPETYPEVIQYMLLANPDDYFRKNLLDTYDIAQKYGGRPQLLHSAGIIYTPTPILLVVMTRNVSDADQVLGDFAELMTEYAAVLDSRVQEQLEEQERLEQEKAAEEELRAAEEQSRKEAEAQAAEMERELEEAEALRDAKERQKAATLIISCASLAVCAVVGILLIKRKKR